ncbi:hypothetical protein [Deinococcus kurensis]|uniref:hypothetical protein n=1 Tax=Deinococcus kurensis TaxID=2662757 RepID=UPI0012D2F4B2|nr:hypothetical protein [Deinococcus kurensis]
MTGTDDLRYSPHFIKATAEASDLLADIEPFEQIGCAFGRVTTALVRLKLRDPHADELEVLGATFRATGLRERLIILSHVAKPLDTDPQGRTLRPFAALLVEHNLTHARLISPNTWTAWVEVSRDGRRWRRLKSDPPPAEPPPTRVVEPDIPPPPLPPDEVTP